MLPGASVLVLTPLQGEGEWSESEGRGLSVETAASEGTRHFIIQTTSYNSILFITPFKANWYSKFDGTIPILFLALVNIPGKSTPKAALAFLRPTFQKRMLKTRGQTENPVQLLSHLFSMLSLASTSPTKF